MLCCAAQTVQCCQQYSVLNGCYFNIVQTSDKQAEIDFQMSANKLYPIVKPAIIVGIIEHAIEQYY